MQASVFVKYACKSVVYPIIAQIFSLVRFLDSFSKMSHDFFEVEIYHKTWLQKIAN